MQTFLPYASFRDSVRCLDNRRLGKQRVEAYQLLRGQWRNHPAARMWVGHHHHLAWYLHECVNEWTSRGFANSISHDSSAKLLSRHEPAPFWLGDDRFHSAHRAALLFKDPDWYEQFGWDELPEVNYWWPVR